MDIGWHVGLVYPWWIKAKFPLHPLTPFIQNVSFQDDCYRCVLWPCWAGVSGEIPVCGLRGKHHIFTWTREFNTVMLFPTFNYSTCYHVMKQTKSGMLKHINVKEVHTVDRLISESWCLITSDTAKHLSIIWEMGRKQQSFTIGLQNIKPLGCYPLIFPFVWYVFQCAAF